MIDGRKKHFARINIDGVVMNAHVSMKKRKSPKNYAVVIELNAYNIKDAKSTMEKLICAI